MPLRVEFLPYLADPSPESWRAICRLMSDGCSREQHKEDVSALARELHSWPPEIERPAPRGVAVNWPGWNLCRRVKETDIYGYYLLAAGKILLSDGTPAVRLQRAFTGSLQGPGGKAFRLGVEGQGDLVGSLCVEWPKVDDEYDQALTAYSKGWSGHPGEPKPCRISVPLEVEVKRDGERLRPAQEVRRDALRARGEIYLVVRRTEEMLCFLREERRRILETLGGLLGSGLRDGTQEA